MTNPVGFSVRFGALQGLKECGTTHGGVRDWVGGGTEPRYDADSGLRFYSAPLGGPWITPPYSDARLTAIGLGGATDGLYDPHPLNGPMSDGSTSTIAADVCATSPCQYVEIQLVVSFIASSGQIHFSDITDPGVLHSFDLTMAGFGAVTYQGDEYDVDNQDYGVANEAIVPPHVTVGAGTQYTVTSGLLRPTALTWPGQDPDNLANRNIWLASEVGAISWASEAYAASVEVAFGVVVHGRALDTDYPTPCPIIPPVPPVPSSLEVGPYSSGVLRNHDVSVTGTIGGGTFSKAELVTLYGRHGAPDPNLVAAIALAESSGDPGAVHANDDGSVDRGLLQINSIHGFDAGQLLDPDYNAEAGKTVSGGWTDFTPWVTYNSGAYRHYL